MIHDYIDMDTQEKIRYVNESSNASTSDYSNVSTGPGSSSGFSTPSSPSSQSLSHSPATATLQTEFSNLNLPSSVQTQHHNHHQQQQLNYTTLQSSSSSSMLYNGNNINTNYNMKFNTVGGGVVTAMVTLPHQQFGGNMQYTAATAGGVFPHNVTSSITRTATTTNNVLSSMKKEYSAKLRILEHPMEKFRFRYKSEMHGTHGSLNGANSKRTPKTFPEVELCNFNGPAVIRCSLFQTNLDSPHSHQLVVRKDDTDICDPHDLHVSPERGYVAQFQNMGIIHTAKKFIFDELLKKKMNRLYFELGSDKLSTKQIQELHKETEKEAKDMNLNQVRLCFEAFKVEENNTWTRIAAPVYTNAINNRKSAQTGELRICRLSIATGSVSGGDDLILLVEKVSKKNIKVRFYELNEDEEIIWEQFGKFRESDVHHQYAIVCQTPAYKDKNIDKPVEVCIELIRPSDDERSYPPVTFRYKPLDVVVSRKRRRTCSTATSSSSGTNSGSSLSSFELPKTVQEQQLQQQQAAAGTNAETTNQQLPGFTSEDIEKLIGDDSFRSCVIPNSEELAKICNYSFDLDALQPQQNVSGMIQLQAQSSGVLEMDGVTSTMSLNVQQQQQLKQAMDLKNKRLIFRSVLSSINASTENTHLQRIFKIYENCRNAKDMDEAKQEIAAKQIAEIYGEYAEKNDNGDTLIHEIITNDNSKLCIKTCHILRHFRLNDLLNRPLNAQNQSGLHCACLHDRVYYIRPLLGLGCDPNIQDRNSNTALHIAVKEQHLKCIESFLNMAGITLDLTIKNDQGLSAIHLALRQTNFDVAKKLLNYNPNAALISTAKEGNNALHLAVLQSSIDLVKLITGKENIRDAILLARNTAGQNAADMARSLNTQVGNEIFAYLTSISNNVTTASMVTTKGGIDVRTIIKEEEMSSTSSTEDDDDATTVTTTPPTMAKSFETLELMNKIKTENGDEDAMDTQDNEHDKKEKETNKKVEGEQRRTTVIATTITEGAAGSTSLAAPDLADILKDDKKFRKLAQLLNVSEKWKDLAQICKMHHLLCLWDNAEGMLNYIKKQSNIDYDLFYNALSKIDEDAMQILRLK